MKQYFLRLFGYTLSLLLIANGLNCAGLRKDKSEQHHYVVDHTSDPSLNNVVRRTPTVTAVHHVVPLSNSPSDDGIMHMSNTSDNNGEDPFHHGYGRKAEIANPAIYVHSKGSLSVVTEQPAHVGWRSERKTITSLNKATSKQIIFNKF